MSIELVVVFGSLLLVHLAGVRGNRKGRVDFVLAERTLSLPLLVATIVATWYGAILASGEFVMRYGVVFMLCFGLPYYLVAVVYAGWLSKRIRSGRASSIPEQLGSVHGSAARRAAALLLLVITIPASYQLMLGHVIRHVTGFGLETSIGLGTAMSVSYIAIGGLRSDVYANGVQAILMFAGMILLATASVTFTGGLQQMTTAASPELFNIPGSLGWAGIVGWWIISMQTFIDPTIYVRTAAAKNVSIARKAILWSVGCWIVFDLLQLISGLAAATHVPRTEMSTSYLALADVVLPPWGKGLVLAGVIAAVSSTLNGYALVSASTIADDVLPGFRPELANWSGRYRTGLVATSLIGALVAMMVPNIIDLIFNTGSIVVSALLLPTLVSHSGNAHRYSSAIVVLLVVPALAAAGAWVSQLGEPALVGIGTSLMLHFAIWLKGAYRP